MYYQDIFIADSSYKVLFVGELKAACLGYYVEQALCRALERPVVSVSLVSDIANGYTKKNIAVINSDGERQKWLRGRPLARRIPVSKLGGDIDREPAVRRLVAHILERQQRLPLWMFESRVELMLRKWPGVYLVGPRAVLTRLLNDKTWQYEAFARVVPMAEHKLCVDAASMRVAVREMLAAYRQRVFVSQAYSAGGGASMVTDNEAGCVCRFGEVAARFLVSRYIPHQYDPTVLGVVANESDVYIAGVADMTIEGGNAFRGSCYPSVLPSDVQAALRDYTAAVGRMMGRLGFRGIFGCDYIVDDAGDIFFIEVNPRKQGTTMEFCCTLERQLPAGAANLLELEYHAVTRGVFPANTVLPDYAASQNGGLWWGTYNHKVDAPIRTTSTVRQEVTERELFAAAVKGISGHIIREHVGEDMDVSPGTFLGRVIAVGTDRQTMHRELSKGRERLAKTVARGGE